MSARRLCTLACGAGVALGATLAGVTTTAAAQVDPEIAAILGLRPDPARGKAAFGACAPCHRRDASGRADGSAPRLSGQHAEVIVKQVVDVRSGRRTNPTMKAVLEDVNPSAQTIADFGAYLQGLPPAGEFGKGPATLVTRGRGLYERDCAACHGGAGEGQPAKFVPVVAAQHYAYLLAELRLIRTGGRGNSDPAMVKVLQPYEAEELQALADFMARLPVPRR